MTATAISTPDAPAPVAAYSQAVRKGNILQIAGQVGADPATGELVAETVLEQTEQTMRNIDAILRAAGATLDDVVMMRVYLNDAQHVSDMNIAYNRFVTEPYPARATVFVGLPPGILVEIDALAVLDV